MCMIFKCSDDTAEFGWGLVNNFITAAGSSLQAGCSLITNAVREPAGLEPELKTQYGHYI